MYRRWIAIVLTALSVVLVVAMGVSYLVDPMHVYRIPTWFAPALSTEVQTYNNAGLARSMDYDTLILGSSMTENFKPSVFDEAFGTHSIKIPFSAARACNHDLILSLAMRTHDVRTVFYGLDVFAFVEAPYTVAYPMREYLFDENLINDISYLLNGTVFQMSIDRLLHYQPGAAYTVDRDEMYTWYQYFSFDEVTAMRSYGFDRERAEMKPAEVYADNVRDNFDRFLRPHLDAHPDVQFYLFFPPYSTLQWYMLLDDGDLDAYMRAREMLTEWLLAYDNVELYDFSANTDWITDLSLYMDYCHYSPDINDAMVWCMADGEFMVLDAYDVYENNDVLYELAEDFPVPERF